LGGSIIYSKKFIKYFLNKGDGKLIHISSIQGVAAPKFDHYKDLEMSSPIAYTAIKSGIIAITRYLAKYYGKKNIR
jgi:NAD(P)-dependent dehydrogenase (short-subunit alcohol dehydrogenase family)